MIFAIIFSYVASSLTLEELLIPGYRLLSMRLNLIAMSVPLLIAPLALDASWWH